MEVPGEEEYPEESGVPQPKNFLATSVFPANQEVADDDWRVAQLPPIEAILLSAAKKKQQRKPPSRRVPRKEANPLIVARKKLIFF